VEAKETYNVEAKETYNVLQRKQQRTPDRKERSRDDTQCGGKRDLQCGGKRDLPKSKRYLLYSKELRKGRSAQGTTPLPPPPPTKTHESLRRGRDQNNKYRESCRRRSTFCSRSTALALPLAPPSPLHTTDTLIPASSRRPRRGICLVTSPSCVCVSE